MIALHLQWKSSPDLTSKETNLFFIAFHPEKKIQPSIFNNLHLVQGQEKPGPSCSCIWKRGAAGAHMKKIFHKCSARHQTKEEITSANLQTDLLVWDKDVTVLLPQRPHSDTPPTLGVWWTWRFSSWWSRRQSCWTSLCTGWACLCPPYLPRCSWWWIGAPLETLKALKWA